MTTLEDYFHALQHGPAFPFRDWPNRNIPAISAGVYTIWNGDAFVYVGMAGHSLDAKSIEAHRGSGAKKSTGLYDRLSSHAGGRRSGDQFCVYVCDRFVLATLTWEDIERIATGALSLDALTRQYIHQHLSYRVVETPDGQTARLVENQIRAGALSCGKPLLNPL